MTLGYHWESMTNYIKHAKVSQATKVISLVRLLWEIVFAHVIKDVTYAFRVIKFAYVMCGAYGITHSRQ